GIRAFHVTGVKACALPICGAALDGGSFSLGIMPAEGVSLQQAEDALDRVLADFIANGVDADQLERVRMQIRAEAIYELDDAAAQIGSASCRDSGGAPAARA